jgi:hypothetical protein
MVSAHRYYPTSEDDTMYLAGPSTTQFEDDLHDALLGEDPDEENEDEEDVEDVEDEGE